jgi:hypothetical protein
LRGSAQTHARYSPPVGWRFQTRRKLLPGVTLNLGKRGAGLSVGRMGARMSASRRGLIATVGLVGTGLAYVWRRNRQRGSS